MSNDDTAAQSALSAWGDSDDESDMDEGTQSDSKAVEGGVSRQSESKGPTRLNLRVLSENATLDDDSCPWCLHPASEFRDLDMNDKIGCPNCGGVIPVDAEWYQNGEKICL